MSRPPTAGTGSRSRSATAPLRTASTGMVGRYSCPRDSASPSRGRPRCATACGWSIRPTPRSTRPGRNPGVRLPGCAITTTSSGSPSPRPPPPAGGSWWRSAPSMTGAALAPYADGIKVRGHPPFVTAGRTIQLADRATDLAPSVLGLNLNPPSVIQNTSWIKPMKYVGIWWGMHIGTMTWSSGPKHGATTANAKRYIDFAAANGLGGVLVEGWNVGWDADWIKNRNAFSFTQAYPDYDLRELAG